jgi:hypothetical protein
MQCSAFPNQRKDCSIRDNIAVIERLHWKSLAMSCRKIRGREAEKIKHNWVVLHPVTSLFSAANESASSETSEAFCQVRLNVHGEKVFSILLYLQAV